MFITKKNKNCFRKQPKVKKVETVSANAEAVVTVVVPEVKKQKEIKKNTARVKKETIVETQVVEQDNEVKETE